MAKGLSYQVSGETKKIEQNRQLVAINNFLWRTDQLIAQREHVSASKMLQKAIGVAGRMDEQPEETMRELRIRKQLLGEREAIVPQLRIAVPRPNDFHVEFFDSSSGPQADPSLEPGAPWPPNRNFMDELEALVYVRGEVFNSELGCVPQLENDERDEISRHCVLYMGDCIIGGGRMWVHHPLPDSPLSVYAPIPVAVLDRLFVIPEYRGRGLARRLLTAMGAEARRLGFPMFVLIRNDTSPQESSNQRFRDVVRSKLATSKSFRMVSSEVRIPHHGVSGGLGAGIVATVFEPCFAGM